MSKYCVRQPAQGPEAVPTHLPPQLISSMPRPHSCHEAEQGTQTGPATSSSSSQVEAWDGLGQAVLLRQSLHKRQACELITAMLQDPGVIFLCSSSEAQPVVPGTGFITERYAVGALFFHTQGFCGVFFHYLVPIEPWLCFSTTTSGPGTAVVQHGCARVWA